MNNYEIRRGCAFVAGDADLRQHDVNDEEVEYGFAAFYLSQSERRDDAAGLSQKTGVEGE